MSKESKETVAIVVLVALLTVAMTRIMTLERKLTGMGTAATIDTTTVIDTIPYYKPVAKDSVVVRYVTARLPIAKDTAAEQNHFAEVGIMADSVTVNVPITQKRYSDSTYTAYVSGYQPSLDSIFVYPRTTVIRERTYKPPNKWHIGLSAGYGFGRQGLSPYVGVGITYSIISF